MVVASKTNSGRSPRQAGIPSPPSLELVAPWCGRCRQRAVPSKRERGGRTGRKSQVVCRTAGAEQVGTGAGGPYFMQVL